LRSQLKIMGLAADTFFLTQFYVLGAATLALTAVSRLGNSSKDANQSSGAALARTYLPVYALIMISDWLQGPYMYRLLASNHGYQPSGIAVLFVIGFLSAAVASPVVGRWADIYGRRFLCLCFCGLYATSCLLICVNSVLICVAARIAGGVSTSILFSVPETWLVSASHTSQLSPATLSSIFGTATLINGFVAVISGVSSIGQLSKLELQKPLSSSQQLYCACQLSSSKLLGRRTLASRMDLVKAFKQAL